MPWLIWTAIGLGGAFAGSIVNNFTTPTPTTPAAGVSDEINVPKMMLYAAGAIGLVYMAKKAKLV